MVCCFRLLVSLGCISSIRQWLQCQSQCRLRSMGTKEHTLVGKAFKQVRVVFVLTGKVSGVTYTLKDFTPTLPQSYGTHRRRTDIVSNLLRCRTKLPTWITEDSPLTVAVTVWPLSEDSYIPLAIYCCPQSHVVPCTSRVNHLVDGVGLFSVIAGSCGQVWTFVLNDGNSVFMLLTGMP